MASNLILILLPLFLSLSSSSAGLLPATPISATPISATTICNSTPYPSFCRSQIRNNATANVYDYGRLSVLESLSSARIFLFLIENHLRRRSTLTVGAINALEDCRFLAGLNLDYLLTSSQTVATSSNLNTLRADDVQTLLSAILTNTQTCLEGLQATASSWSSKNGIYTPLSNETKLFSVSLALFTRGWVSKNRTIPSSSHPTKKTQLAFGNGRLPLKMSDRSKAIYEGVSRRKLLQTDGDDQVLIRDVVVVSQNGTGNFTTVSDAVEAAPNKTKAASGYFLIYVTAGVYEEYVLVPKYKKYVMIIGDGINQTVITGNRSVVDGWTTFNSFTFAVVGEGFVGVNITFRNTAGPVKHQAVAVRNGADLSTFYSCSFEGYQDTLYIHSLRQFYRECDIYGTVDFIFGNAAAVFQNCNIYPRLPLPNQFNAITAHGRTDPNQNTGISIQNSTIRAADDLGSSDGTTQTYLGRPWKEYSRTVYMQSFIDNLVNSAGWREWSGDFALNTTYYAEFNNSGPGSDTSGRVTWPGFHVINNTDAADFAVTSFVLGNSWLPQTGVPYLEGLI